MPKKEICINKARSEVIRTSSDVSEFYLQGNPLRLLTSFAWTCGCSVTQYK